MRRPCDRDPAAVARRLRTKGIDLRIDVVGFDVSGDTRRQLERIADAELTLSTPGGQRCASETALQADRLILQIRRTQAPDHGRVPFELAVVVEPAVAGQVGLPKPFDGSLSDDASVRRSRPERMVAAGGASPTPPASRPAPGPTACSPVRSCSIGSAPTGATPAVSFRFGPDREVSDALTGYVFTTVTAYGPMRQPLGNEVLTVHGSFIGDEVEQADLKPPPVRYVAAPRRA